MRQIHHANAGDHEREGRVTGDGQSERGSHSESDVGDRDVEERAGDESACDQDFEGGYGEQGVESE